MGNKGFDEGPYYGESWGENFLMRHRGEGGFLACKSSDSGPQISGIS